MKSLPIQDSFKQSAMANRTVSVLLCCFLCVSLFAQKKKRDNSESLLNNNKINRNIIITNTVNINSEALEFSPVLYQNGLVYVSSRFKSGAVDEKIGETFFELFYSEMDKNGIPGKPETFSVEINSQVHEGPSLLIKMEM